MTSLPSWERGLKPLYIEEILPNDTSLPSWERGLKLTRELRRNPETSVAPFVGAWIETNLIVGLSGESESRSLRGSVD